MTRTERTYYLVFALYCFSWSFIAPVYPLFLLSRGLDLFQINVVLATYLITACIFEVPTGAIADLAGRKVSFLLSCATRMVAFALYAFAHSFVDCIIAEFIDAVGTTLASGALDAWAVDGMHADGVQRAPDRFFARAQILARTLMITSGLAGGYLGDHGLELVWGVGAAGFAVTAVVAAVAMREHRASAPRVRGGLLSTPRSLGRTMRAGVQAVSATPVLLVLCVLTLVTAFATMPIQMYWQPRMQAVTASGFWLMGWIWAFLNLSSIAGSALIPRALGRLAREHVLAAAAVWRGIMLAVAGTAATVYPALGGLLLQEVSFGLSEPLIQAWLNEHIAPERRATVLSVRAMAFTFGGAAGLVCLGLVARDIGMATAWVVSAIVFVVTAPGFVVLGRLARRTLANTAEAAGRLPAPLIPPA